MNFTQDFIIHNLHFSLIFLAVIVFIDLIIKFKSPLQLKFYFLSVTICSAFPSFFSFIASGPDQFVLEILVFKGFVRISVVQIFTLLYFQNHKKVANAYSLFTIAYISLLLYYSFTNESIIPKYNTISGVMPQRDFDFNLPFFGKALSYVYLIYSNFICLYYIYFILFKYSFNNVYFKKIQNWTIAFFLYLTLVLFGFLLTLFLAKTNTIFHYLSIGATLYTLLLILYRPNFLNKNGLKISFGQAFNKNPINEIRADVFEYHFFSNFYYKKKDASISDFANVIGVGKELVANHVNNAYFMSFEELVNKSRIEYFVEIIKDPNFKNYTVEALALEVGFSSRQRFYQPFKKYHGGNPSDLIYIYN